MKAEEVIDAYFGKTVFVFDTSIVMSGTLMGRFPDRARFDDLGYCPGGKIGDELFYISFDPRLEYEPEQDRYTKSCIFPTFKEAKKAQEQYLQENPQASEAVARESAESAAWRKSHPLSTREYN